MGQTIIHILVDGYLKTRSESERARMAELLSEMDRTDPGWLKRLIREHLAQTQFWWRLYPGMSGVSFKRLRRLKLAQRLVCWPAAAASSLVALVSGRMAFIALKAGCTDYWPQAQRQGLEQAPSKV